MTKAEGDHLGTGNHPGANPSAGSQATSAIGHAEPSAGCFNCADADGDPDFGECGICGRLPATSSRWPHLTPLEVLLTEALEGVMGAAELGDYLRERCSYNYGDRHTQPEEFGIEWHWQQSTPEDGWAMRLGAEIEAHLADVAEAEEDLGETLRDWQRNPVLIARAALEAAKGGLAAGEAKAATPAQVGPGMPPTLPVDGG